MQTDQSIGRQNTYSTPSAIHKEQSAFQTLPQQSNALHRPVRAVLIHPEQA